MAAGNGSDFRRSSCGRRSLGSSWGNMGINVTGSYRSCREDDAPSGEGQSGRVHVERGRGRHERAEKTRLRVGNSRLRFMLNLLALCFRRQIR